MIFFNFSSFSLFVRMVHDFACFPLFEMTSIYIYIYICVFFSIVLVLFDHVHLLSRHLSHDIAKSKRRKKVHALIFVQVLHLGGEAAPPSPRPPLAVIFEAHSRKHSPSYCFSTMIFHQFPFYSLFSLFLTFFAMFIYFHNVASCCIGFHDIS